jgi:hypothetical protein
VPRLRSLADMAASGCLVKPLLHQFLMDEASSADINILVQRPKRRPFDGWFHASQHPLATERELYLWMTGQATGDPFTYQARCAVLFGSLFHGVFEAFLEQSGFAEPLPSEGTCPACGRPRRALRARPSARYCTEHGFSSAETRARCHLDSVVKFGDDRYGFDLKTIWPLGLKGVRDMDIEQFREKWPGYWAQGQECMRLSGLRRYIFTFMTMGSPWDTREFHFDFDPDFNVKTEQKYKTVIYHVDNNIPIAA